MDNIYEIREQAKRFNSKLSGKTLAIAFPVAIILGIIVSTWDYWWVNLLFVIFILILMVAVFLYVSRKQKAVLIYDMNPQLYYAIIHAGDVVKIGEDPDIEIFYFAGDYQKAIQFAQAEIDKATAKGKKYANFITLDVLAFAYFEIGDFDNALKTIDYIKNTANELKLSNKKGYTQVILPQLEYIENFVKYDFNKCLELENMMTAKNKKSNTFIARNKYYIAIAKYYMGDVNGAKTLFDEIMQFCPMLNYSNLAQQYLNSIHNNEIMTLSMLNTDFKYDGSIVAPNPKQTKKAKRRVIATLILGVIALLFCCISSFIPSDDEQDMNEDYFDSVSIVFDIQQE